MTHSPSVLFTRLVSKAKLRHLQLIAQIGELGSLQKAADAVHMSQPAATKAVLELEQLLGVALFERHSRGMRPTGLGSALLPLVRRTIGTLQEFAEVVSAMGTGTTSNLRIGAVGGGLSGLLCRVVPPFSAAFPQVVIHVAQLGPEELLVALVQGVFDLAICRQPEQLPQGLLFTPLSSDRYVVVCGPEHPLAGKKRLRLDDLAHESWLMPEQIGVSADGFRRLWEELGSSAEICWVTSRSPLLVMAMLEQRRLLRYVPYSTVRHQLDSGALVTLPGPWELALPPLGALAHAHEAESMPTVSAFIELLKEKGDLTDGTAELERVAG
jgi:DNA-binding transcriptional LysR family regulator